MNSVQIKNQTTTYNQPVRTGSVDQDINNNAK